MDDLTNRGQFLNLAALFEGGLVLVAIVLGWFADVNPLEYLILKWESIAWGVIASVPMIILFLFSYRFPVGPFLKIKRFLVEMLGPPLAACRWYDLILLAIIVGFCEEILFRGVLQPWFEKLWEPAVGSWAVGLVGSNVFFGLAHFITPLYGVMAGLIGCYLGWLLDVSGERNVLIPVITHAVYDYLAFVVVVRGYRQELDHPAQNSLFEDE